MVEIMDGIHSLDFSERKNHDMELWVLECSEGTVLVDTGMGDEVLGDIEGVLTSYNKGWSDVVAILITHRHGDHIRNLAKVKELTGAKVYAHKDEVPEIQDQTGVEVEGLEDGSQLPFCGGIKLVHVPGHTRGNCSYYLPAKKAMIAGDTIFGDEEGNLIPPPERYCLDVDQATREIKRLLDYDYDALIYTHGKDVLELGKEKIRTLVEKTR